MRSHHAVATVDLRIVERGAIDAGLQIVGHDQARHAAEEKRREHYRAQVANRALTRKADDRARLEELKGSLPAAMAEAFGDMFREFDVDGNGILTRAELEPHMTSVGGVSTVRPGDIALLPPGHVHETPKALGTVERCMLHNAMSANGSFFLWPGSGGEGAHRWQHVAQASVGPLQLREPERSPQLE